jgi:hypothetical protein
MSVEMRPHAVVAGFGIRLEARGVDSGKGTRSGFACVIIMLASMMMLLKARRDEPPVM